MKIITSTDIEHMAIKNSQVLDWIKQAFCLKNDCDLPHKVSQTFNGGTNFFNTMPSIIPSLDSFGVKVVSRFPERVPSISGELLLYSLGSGKLLSLMDATWITKKRTGAVAAVAVETFARKNFESIAIVGLGTTGLSFLDMFIEESNNKLKHFKLMKYKDHAEKAFKYLKSKGVKSITICDSMESLICDSDVIVSSITYTDTLLGKNEWYKKGVLVVPIHTRGFQNCDLFFDKVYADDTKHVNGFQNFSKFKKFDEISNVLNKSIAGRESDDERILSYNIGIAVHDVYVAKKVFDVYSSEISLQK
jgi:ornithine cyclodeaminase/alanine dehydrogenase-like protein (mu-crystallin family)